jgi:hypothetical protein
VTRSDLTNVGRVLSAKIIPGLESLALASEYDPHVRIASRGGTLRVWGYAVSARPGGLWVGVLDSGV